MEVTFYGTRGSCPCAGDHYGIYGGNTSCGLVRVEGSDPLILDLGTGLRTLSDAVCGPGVVDGVPLQATALLTHLHFDHIIGLPFFGPLHRPGSRLTVYGPRQEEGTLRQTLASAVKPPFFPVELAGFHGEIEFVDTSDEEFSIGVYKVRARAVPHPGHTLGFRIEADGRSLAYVPDHQAPPDRASVPDQVLELCRGADLLVHDAQYTDEEFEAKPHWGHSTVAYAVKVAAEAGARQLLLFHHDPSHDDREVELLADLARALPQARRLQKITAAREGVAIDLGRA